MDHQPTDRIVIIGAGVFGLSTALHLAQAGFTDITVLDRSLPPVADGSSVDISRIIRADYADPVYAALGKEALAEWERPDSVFHAAFHACPFLLAVQDAPAGGAAHAPGPAYLDEIRSNLRTLGLTWTDLTTAAEAQRRFPALMGGPLAGPGFAAFVNEGAGWADAALGVALARDACVALGVSFVGGPAGTVTRFCCAPDGRVEAVETAGGLRVAGHDFVLATGAWTAGLVGLGNRTLSTAQIVGFIKLDEEEQANLASLPIYINLTTGFFTFPTHAETGLLKVACHGLGYTNTSLVDGADGQGPRNVSLPPRRAGVPRRAIAVPDEGIARLRSGLSEVFGPGFAKRPFQRTALCWYTETATGDYVVDRHPRHANLLVATGGSGHAYKMLPILGRYVVQALRGELAPLLRHRWRLQLNDDEVEFVGDGSRGGPPRREFTAVEKAKL